MPGLRSSQPRRFSQTLPLTRLIQPLGAGLLLFFAIRKGIYVALDLQEIFNPAYNRDRGPVFVASGRLHLEF
jgi:hypothetical protein